MIYYFVKVFEQTIIQMLYSTGLLIISGYFLGVLARLSEKYFYGAFGKRGLLATAWLGTPVHELGHAFMCILFNHQIQEIRLLNYRNDNGVLGYVNHSYHPNSFYERIGNFFIGIGPLLSGTGSLLLSLYLLLPSSYRVFKDYLQKSIGVDNINLNLISHIIHSTYILLGSIFKLNNLSTPQFWLFILTSVCISSHLALSSADIKGSGDGLIAIFIIIFLTNIILVYFNISTNRLAVILIKYNIHLLSLLIVAVLFSSLTLLISYTCYFLISRTKILLTK